MEWGLGDTFCLWAILSRGLEGMGQRMGSLEGGYGKLEEARETAQRANDGARGEAAHVLWHQGLVGKSRQVSCRLPLCLSRSGKGCCV